MKRPPGFWAAELTRIMPTKLTKEELAEKYDTTVDNLNQIFHRYGIYVGKHYARKPEPKEWRKYEKTAIKKYYAWHGAEWLSNHLAELGYNRSVYAIRVYATKHMIDGYAPEGYVVIHHTHQNGIKSSIGKQAKRDGVLKRAAKAWVVPEDWYDNYLAEEMELIEHANKYSDWVTIRDIAMHKRMSESTLRSQWRRNVKMGAKLNRIPRETIYYPVKTYVWHPDALKI